MVDDPSWTFSGAYAESSATPGRVEGNANQVVNGVGPARSANFVVLGWSANLGSTVGDIENYFGDPFAFAYVGESSVYGYTLGDGSTIPGFVLGTELPEPSTLALVGLGGVACVAARRKSKL